MPGRGVLPDGTTRMALRGRPVYHYGHVATYASRTVVHESCAIRIDPAMPLDRAALIGCSVMTGRGRGDQHRRGPRGRAMAVFGVGGVGLNVVQGGAIVAAHPIIAVDTAAQPSSTTPRAVGATHGSTRRPRIPSPPSARSPAAAPTSPSWRWAPRVPSPRRSTRWRPGGTCVLIGVPETGATVPLDVAPAGHRRSAVIRGSSYGSARTREDLPAAGAALSGRPAAHRRADHPSLRARGRQRGVPRARRRRARPRPHRLLMATREIVFALEFRGPRRGRSPAPPPSPGAHHRAQPGAARRARRRTASAASGGGPRGRVRGARVAGGALPRRHRSWRTAPSPTAAPAPITFDTVGRGHVGPSPRAGSGATAW